MNDETISNSTPKKKRIYWLWVILSVIVVAGVIFLGVFYFIPEQTQESEGDLGTQGVTD